MSDFSFDPNANSGDRMRRAFQKLSQGAITETIRVAAPITNLGSPRKIGLAVLTSTGLAVVNNSLALKFADASIVGSSTGIMVNISPATGAGVLKTFGSGFGLASQASTLVLAGPSTGAAATPTFRSLVSADIPDLAYVDSVAAGDSSIKVTGATDTPAVAVQYGSTGSTLLSTVSGDGVDLVKQASTLIFAGPSSGAAAAPTFRSLVAADIPDLAYVDSVTAGDASITIGGGSDTPTVAVHYGSTGSTLLSTVAGDGIDLVKVASTLVFAGPSTGASAVPTFRALTANDIPGGGGGVSSVTAGDASITIGGTASNPTVAVVNDPNGGTSTGSNGLLTKLIYFNTADSGTLNNVTTFQAFSLQKTLPANFFTQGKKIRITSWGSITANAAQQIALNQQLASFAIQGPNMILGGSAQVLFKQTCIVTCRTTGVSGSFVVELENVYNIINTTTSQTTLFANVATLNTTGTIVVMTGFAATVGNNSAVENEMFIEVWE